MSHGDNMICNPCNTATAKKARAKNMGPTAEAVRRYEKKNPLRRKAWNAVFVANRANKRANKAKKTCKVCKSNARIHAHHPDVNKPLSVVFLCPLHHKAVHLGKIKCPLQENMT